MKEAVTAERCAGRYPSKNIKLLTVIAPFVGKRDNVRCLDEDLLDRFTIESFDGQNWEQNIDSIL